MNAPADPRPASSADEPASSSPANASTPANEASPEIVVSAGEPLDTKEPLQQQVKTLLIGKPLDLGDKQVFQHVSLIAFLAWVGLGADGLSSSCYGPAEAFHNLGGHSHLAVLLALATIITVLVISRCYSHIIEEFPAGGGGYLVASKLLGHRAGVLSGSALLVDYVLTITVSIAAAGDALFDLIDPRWEAWKLTAEIGAILLLIVLNLRGIKESVVVLVPIFLTFLATHAIVIGGSMIAHLSAAGSVVQDVTHAVKADLHDPSFGFWAMLALLLHAYSLGGGTYTGIEAVSNSMPVMREPRVATAKRTMVYMALSLSFMAGGLMLAYLLLDIHPEQDKTMNFLLTERLVADSGWSAHALGTGFLWITILSEGLLLFVAAQAGFVDGPRVLAYMAHDSYIPHWFANLSERLTTHNGVFVMGLAALAALVYTDGSVSALVVMYSINVFLTFSLSMVGMCRHWWGLRQQNPLWRKRLALFGFGATLCLSILTVTVYEKFHDGGYLTLLVTSLCVILCMQTRRYYRRVETRLKALDTLTEISAAPKPNYAPPNPDEPTAVVLVGGYNGLGVHTLLNALRLMPNYFENIVFVSVGVVDSGNFKGARELEELQNHTTNTLTKYVDMANQLGLPATSFMAIGTDPVDELERLCSEVAKRFPKGVFFAGNLVFRRDTWFRRLMHNQTAYSLQRRLQWDGVPMIILPTRVR